VALAAVVAVFALLPPTVGTVLQPLPAAGPAPPPEVADRRGGPELSGVLTAPAITASENPDAGSSAGATPARATSSASRAAKTISRWFAIAAKLARRHTA
jgi:hypothetical protein